MTGPVIRRLYYSVREASKVTGVPPNMLRQWEIKFPDLNPAKSKTGRRLFKEKDFSMILKIKKFKENGYTDEKIRELIRKENDDQRIVQINDKNHKVFSEQIRLPEIIQTLQEILDILNT